MKKGLVFLMSVMLLGLGLTTLSVADPNLGHGKSMHGDHDSMQGHGGGSKVGHNKKHKKGGTFSSHWAKTLTDEQKISFDKMHLAVGQFEAVQRAKLKMLESELNVLAGKNGNNKSAIYAKIDEILDVKKSIMRNRYDHIAEMRSELTDQQRISYDMGILKRGKHKH